MSELPEHGAIGVDAAAPETMASAMSPGARLAAERQAHGLTVEQVASQLNLAPRQIVALEADDYAALPGMVIVRGFLRAYAKLLKIDPTPLLAVLVDKHAPASATPMRHALSASFSESRLPSLTGSGAKSIAVPVAAAVAVVLAACVASYALGWWPDSLVRKVGQLKTGAMNGTNPAADAVAARPTSEAPFAATAGAEGAPAQRPAVPANTVTAEVPLRLQDSAVPVTALTAGTPASAPTVVPAGTPPVATPPAAMPPVAPAARGAPVSGESSGATLNPLVLSVRDDSWVEIKRADNTPVIGKIIKGGSVETFDVNEPVTVIIGNIAGVEASLRGTPLDLASAANGNVARLRLK